MQAEELFRVALGFGEQWKVVETRLDTEARRLDVRLDFVKGAKFPCPQCGCSCGAYDTAEKEWRHLDFIQYSLYLTAPLPRVECPEHGVKLIKAEWARPWSGSSAGTTPGSPTGCSKASTPSSRPPSAAPAAIARTETSRR